MLALAPSVSDMLTKALVIALVGSLVIGQSIRFPLPGQGGGVLLSDLVVVTVLIGALASVVREKSEVLGGRQQATSANTTAVLLAARYLLLFTPFIIWSLFTLVINYWRYDGPQLVVAGAYWIRLTAHLLLLPALLLLVQRKLSSIRW